jgi:hypothetical protein
MIKVFSESFFFRNKRYNFRAVSDTQFIIEKTLKNKKTDLMLCINIDIDRSTNKIHFEIVNYDFDSLQEKITIHMPRACGKSETMFDELFKSQHNNIDEVKLKLEQLGYPLSTECYDVIESHVLMVNLMDPTVVQDKWQRIIHNIQQRTI